VILWPGVDGAGVVPPSLGGTGQQGAEVGPRWWNPLDSAAIDARIAAGGYWAWRAQANDNVTWGPGPANYAASLVSVEGSATVLVEGNGVVPWVAATGWGFVAGNVQWLDTGILGADNDWLMLIQFSDLLNGSNTVLCGARGAQTFDLQISAGGANALRYNHRTLTSIVPKLLAGNFGFVNQTGYRNGVLDGAIGNITIPLVNSIYIGCTNNFGVAALFTTSNIQAILICDDATAFAAPDITAIAALPAGSMHNL